jgi:hypothetical protein
MEGLTFIQLVIFCFGFFFKVCGTTGKRKACKNCSCGLAEELAAEGKDVVAQPTQSKTSACGNVNLSVMSIILTYIDVFIHNIRKGLQCFGQKTLGRYHL